MNYMYIYTHIKILFYILPWCLINNVINKVERKKPLKKVGLKIFLFSLNLKLEKNPIRRKVKETLKKRLYL